MIALLAIALRGVVGTHGLDPHTCQIKSEFDFGFEQGHIAGNLARGMGYSVKFGDAAPLATAWASPAYPLLLAGIFKIWGPFTLDSAVALIWMNATCHGAIAGLLFLLGHRIGRARGSVVQSAASWDNPRAQALWPEPDSPDREGRQVGLFAVALFLLMPAGWQFLHWAWCIHLLAALILLHLLVLLSEFQSRAWRAALAGATLAMAMLADGAAVMLLPLTSWCVCFPGRTRRDRLQSDSESLSRDSSPCRRYPDCCSRMRGLGAFAAAWILVLSPWMIRNGLVLGSWSPLRGMLGTALWMGNHPGTAAEHYHGLHMNPWHNPDSARRFLALGERGFDADCKARFFSEIRRNPGEFVKSCGMRFTGFWLGEWWLGWRDYPAPYSAGTILSTLLMSIGSVLAVRRGKPIGPLLAMVALFPLSYYATFLSYGRYRFPIEPVMHLIAAAGLARFIRLPTTTTHGLQNHPHASPAIRGYRRPSSTSRQNAGMPR